jgi:hypothetical protein
LGGWKQQFFLAKPWLFTYLIKQTTKSFNIFPFSNLVEKALKFSHRMTTKKSFPLTHSTITMRKKVWKCRRDLKTNIKQKKQIKWRKNEENWKIFRTKSCFFSLVFLINAFSYHFYLCRNLIIVGIVLFSHPPIH